MTLRTNLSLSIAAPNATISAAAELLVTTVCRVDDQYRGHSFNPIHISVRDCLVSLSCRMVRVTEPGKVTPAPLRLIRTVEHEPLLDALRAVGNNRSMATRCRLIGS